MSTEPVVLRYTLRNAAGRGLKLSLGLDRITNFTFLLTSPDGTVQRVQPNINSRANDQINTLPVSIPASGEFSREIVLNEWLRFALVGSYSLVVQLRLTGDVSVDVSAAPLKITVVPRDETRLRAKCADLLDRLRKVRHWDEAGEWNGEFLSVEQQLAWSRDPVAIPFLEDALAEGRSTKLFATLVAVGTLEAKAALERLAKSPIGTISSNAKSSLAVFILKSPV